MVISPQPTAGWYTDPQDPNSERYWTGSQWSQQSRPALVVPRASGSPAAALPANPPPAPAVPGRKHHLFHWSLDEIVQGLRSDDPAARSAAAKKLRRVKGSAADRIKVELACLDDPHPAVRYHAIRALVARQEDRERFMALVLSGKKRDAAAKARALADIAGITGPESPFKGKKGLQALNFCTEGSTLVQNFVHSALERARSADTRLPLLVAAREIGQFPHVVRPWPRRYTQVDETFALEAGDQLGEIKWPDRCCVCGVPHPLGRQDLPFTGIVTESLEANTIKQTVAKGTLTVPVCRGGRCEAPKVPVSGTGGLRVMFPSPEFVAELVDNETWFIS